MKKNLIIGIVVVLVLAVGGFFLFNNSNLFKTYEDSGESSDFQENVDEESKPISDFINAAKRKLLSNNNIPSCGDKKELFTVSPVDLDEIDDISPLGGLHPPGHTFPTEHIYIAVNEQGLTTEIIPLRAPGDIVITSVTSNSDFMAPDRKDYSIKFSLCKDVHGYYNHVKEISDGLKEELNKVKCTKFGIGGDDSCEKRISYKVAAGTVIGGVGHLQGNFDLGTYDTRTLLEYVNMDRYSGERSIYIVCPLDYFEQKVQAELYGKIAREEAPRCGVVSQDVPATLQGNWFFGDSNQVRPWDEHLSFVHSSDDPNYKVISVGGVFTDANFWKFVPAHSGTVNRDFDEVKADGKIYCYDNLKAGNFGWSDLSGRIIVELTSDVDLKIEHQSGSCSGSYSFKTPTLYGR
ncbi:MAG: hypothetical protein KJI72_00655 [Patescibacteria group bacterium]|nr:hypothetical protein [Patescibacteria group bacterium]